MTLVFLVILVQFSQAGNDNDIEYEEINTVTINITNFDVNDTSLKIGWEIINNTNHDVWICDSLDYMRGNNFETFIDADSNTLLIRRRLDVPTSAIWRLIPSGRYILLRPGENRTESIELDLPVQSKFIYTDPGLTEVAKHTRSIALEIGFYNEDLPAMVRTILQEADKFDGTNFGGNQDIKKDYFRGLLVRSRLGSLQAFDKVNEDPYGEGKVLIRYSYQALTGEKVLRVLIDGVSIPYEGYAQAKSYSGNKIKDIQSQKASNSNEEKPVNEKAPDQNSTKKS